MLNNRLGSAVFAASTTAGLLALVGTWFVLVGVDGAWPQAFEWIAACSYGLSLGAASAAVYLACGGRSLGTAVNSSLVAIVIATQALAVLMALGATGDVPWYALPLVAFFLFYWLLLIAAVVLVVPATFASILVFGFAYALRIAIAGVQRCRNGHTIGA